MSVMSTDLPSSNDPGYFVPPQYYHCLSYPDYQDSRWRERVVSLVPPEPQFRDMCLLRMTRAFDPAYYLQANPDVAQDERDPFEHYLYHGAGENRWPHPAFDPEQYRRKTDLEPDDNPLLHHLFSRNGTHPFEYQEINTPDPTPDPVWLDLKSRDFEYDRGRHALSLTIALLEAGHPVILTPGGLMQAKIPSIQLLQKLPGVWRLPSIRSVPGHAIRITDRSTSRDIFIGRTIRIRLSAGVSSSDLLLPYSMHNSVLLSRAHRYLSLARMRDRTIDILFAGQNPLSYRFTRMARSYGLVNRHKVLQTAQTCLRDRCVTDVNHDRFIQQRRPGDPPAVFIDSRKWRIIPQCWLDRIGYARFFLCPPGALHPVSHNLIEALSVGTVPILEYDSLLKPPLQDGVNCLAYRGVKGLRDKLEQALSMPGEQWKSMHQSAIKYFNQHLDFTNRLASALRPNSSVDSLALPFKH